MDSFVCFPRCPFGIPHVGGDPCGSQEGRSAGGVVAEAGAGWTLCNSAAGENLRTLSSELQCFFVLEWKTESLLVVSSPKRTNADPVDGKPGVLVSAQDHHGHGQEGWVYRSRCQCCFEQLQWWRPGGSVFQRGLRGPRVTCWIPVIFTLQVCPLLSFQAPVCRGKVLGSTSRFKRSLLFLPQMP